MAVPGKQDYGTAKKDHRSRKNGRSAEIFAQERAEKNAKRGKQIWVWDCEPQDENDPGRGHWERKAA